MVERIGSSVAVHVVVVTAVSLPPGGRVVFVDTCLHQEASTSILAAPHVSSTAR